MSHCASMTFTEKLILGNINISSPILCCACGQVWWISSSRNPNMCYSMNDSPVAYACGVSLGSINQGVQGDYVRKKPVEGQAGKPQQHGEVAALRVT